MKADTTAQSTPPLRWSGHWIGHQPRAAAETPAPVLIMFIFFNRKIVEGMAAGSVKG